MRATMKGAVLLVALAAALAASPALAQTAALPGAEGENPPDYVLQENGTVVIDGDGATDCPSFAAFLEQGYFESGDVSPGAQRVLDRCEQAGLLDPELAASAADGEGGGLPETGGPNLPVLLAVVGVLAMAGGLLLRDIAKE